jgi:uncharacterized protein (DUF3084 family)
MEKQIQELKNNLNNSQISNKQLQSSMNSLLEAKSDLQNNLNNTQIKTKELQLFMDNLLKEKSELQNQFNIIEA